MSNSILDATAVVTNEMVSTDTGARDLLLTLDVDDVKEIERRLKALPLGGYYTISRVNGEVIVCAEDVAPYRVESQYIIVTDKLVNLITFGAATVPSVITYKKMSANRWLAVQLLLF